jgi:hypothetical protein
MISSPSTLANQGPEYEITRLLTELSEWQAKVIAQGQINRQKARGVVRQQSQQFFAQAKTNFNQREWIATVRNLNAFLNESQTPGAADYLRAQYMLGYAYQQVGYEQSAARAYLRYLAAYITEKNYSEPDFTAVIQNLTGLQDKLSKRNTRKLKELLSALASLELPNGLKAEVIFLNALTASTQSIRKYSQEWFEEARKLSNNQRLKAQTLFYQAILAVQNGEDQQAETAFKKILNLKSDAIIDLENLARLSLARLAAAQNKTQTALTYYQTLPSDSLLYREALNEQVYLHLERGESNEAEVKAKMLLKRYPESQEAQALRSRLAFLNLQSGNFDQAQDNIARLRNELQTIKRWIHRNFPADEPVYLADISALKQKVAPYFDLPPVLSRAAKMFQRLGQIADRLADYRAEVRSLVLALGRFKPEQYQPNWTHRATQLDQTAQAIMKLGDRLVAMETSFYVDRMSKTSQASLETLRQRRLALKEPARAFHRARGDPQKWSRLAQMNLRLGELYERAGRWQAEVNGLWLQTQTTTNADLKRHGPHLKALRSRLSRVIAAIQRAVELTRSRQIQNLANQGRHQAVKQYFLKYAQALYEESVVLEPIRDQYQTPSELHMAQDLMQAWQKWRFTAERLYEQIQGLSDQIRDQLKHDLTEMERMVQTYDGLMKQVRGLEQNLAQTIGKTMPANTAHLDHQIDSNESRLWKWEADMDWLSYSQRNQRRLQQQEQFKVKSVKIQEQIRNIEQGEGP